MSFIMRLNAGRSKFVPLKPSSMYSSSISKPCSFEYALRILR